MAKKHFFSHPEHTIFYYSVDIYCTNYCNTFTVTFTVQLNLFLLLPLKKTFFLLKYRNDYYQLFFLHVFKYVQETVHINPHCLDETSNGNQSLLIYHLQEN